ncbi:MAG: HAD-IA family hydrolase [Nitrosopumilaceae archaeon]
MIKGIVFDLDGTLVRLPIRYDLVQNNLKKIFNTQDEFKPLIAAVVSFAKGNASKINEAFESICQEESRAADEIEIIENAFEVLQFFKSKQVKLGLVTMQCRKAVEKVMSKIDQLNVFSSIISRDESYDRKEQIEKTLEGLQLVPDEVLVIGDRIHDIVSAKKAGCRAILVNREKSKHVDVETVEKLANLKNISLV